MRRYDENLLGRLCEYIYEYQKETGESPSYRDIMRAIPRDFSSTAKVRGYLQVLKNRGMIETESDGSIAVDYRFRAEAVNAPLIGVVACGQPIEAIENIEGSYALSPEIFGSGELMLLRADGNSMTEAGIDAGDLIVIRKQADAYSGDSYDGDFIEAKGHDYESKIVKPTCTAQGYTRYTCKTCGNTYTDHFVEAEGPKYGEWTTVKEPTCVDIGKDERTCSVCSYVDEQDTDALGHSYIDNVVDPSCTERGNTIHECERCGHTYTDSYTDATGHDFGEWTSLTNPTCTASGVMQRKCADCPQTETKIVSPLGHDYKAEVVEPTCLEQGYTTHICSRCGTGYNDMFVSPLGHDYEEIEVAPTCTEEGYRGKKCRRCEDCVKTEILKAVGHKFTDSYFIATCEDE